MGKQSYSEKLLDPRWQKRRLEILNRDGFKCRSCCDGSKTLHVHHLRYDNSLEPWEYEDDDLVTLCADCHKVATYIDASCRKLDIGMESIYCIVNLYQEIEMASLDKFIKERAERDAALGIKHDYEF